MCVVASIFYELFLLLALPPAVVKSFAVGRPEDSDKLEHVDVFFLISGLFQDLITLFSKNNNA